MVAAIELDDPLALCELILSVCDSRCTLPNDGLGPNTRGGEADCIAAQVRGIWNWIVYNGTPTRHQTEELLRLADWAKSQA